MMMLKKLLNTWKRNEPGRETAGIAKNCYL